MANPTAAQYKCTGSGDQLQCYDFQSPTTHAQILAFQNVINQFSASPDIGFSPIGVDGVIGKATTVAAFWALTIASMDPGVSTDTAVTADAYLSQLNTAADITAALSDVTATLQAAASQLGLPIVPPPAGSPNPGVPPTQRGGNAAAIAKATQIQAAKGLQASVFDTLSGLGVPMWAQIVGGLAIIAGGYFAFERYKKTHA